MIREKYARFASFMIDMLIMQMFAQILFIYLLGPIIHLTFTNIVTDFVVVIFYMLLFIVIGIIYQSICFRFIHNSLGKQLMRLQYYHTDGTPLDLSTVIRREFLKYYLLYATVFVYGAYSLFRILMRSEKTYYPYHDKKMDTYVTWRS